MRLKRASICIILMLIMLMMSNINITKGAIHDGILNSPAVRQDDATSSSDSSVVGSFKYYNLPEVSYKSGATRKYAVRLISVTGTTRKAVQFIYTSNAAAKFAGANISHGGDMDANKANWTGVLAKDNKAIAAIGKTNSKIGSFSGTIFKIGYGSKINGWNNNTISSRKSVSYDLSRSSDKYYAMASGGEYVSLSSTEINKHSWVRDLSDRIGIAVYLDEEPPSLSWSYNNSTNTLTVKATDKTTDPVPAAGVRWYGWTNNAAATKLDSPQATYSATKVITSSGTVYFSAADDYDNLKSGSKKFYEIKFNYNYDGGQIVKDYKMAGKATPYLAAPERFGYDFKGWATSATATSGVLTGDITADVNEEYFATWKINNSLVNATITLNPTTYVYDGTAKTPTVTVYFGDVELTKDTDYTVEYSNNVNVGTAIAKIKGINKYTGENSAEFTITPRSISTGTFTLGTTSYIYNGTQRKPSTTLVVNSKTLVLSTDYTLAYTNNINAGTATVTATGKGNYKDTISTTFTIKEKEISVVWGETTFTYNASPQIPTATANSGVAGETINLSIVTPQTNHGTYTASASIGSVSGGQGKASNYILKNTSTSFTIGTKSITSGTFQLNPSQYIYNGGENKPTPIVIVDGRTLVNGSEYQIEYFDNIDTGTASATVTGINNYKDTLSQTFVIKPKTLEVKWEKTTFVYNGTSQKPTAYVNTGVTGETMTLIISGEQTNAGTYEAVATIDKVTGGRNRNENYQLSNNTVNFIINKSGRNLRALDAVFTYDGTAHSLVATQDGDGVIQYSSNNTLTNAGTVLVTIWVEETANWLYEETTAYLTVEKQRVPVIWGNTSLPYIGKAQRPTAQATAKGPNDSDVNAEMILKGAATDIGGPYLATASPVNTNYILEPNKIEFYIVANPDIILSGELDQTVFIYDGELKKPNTTVWAEGLPDIEKIELVKGRDYIVEYENNLDPSEEAVAKVIGTGNFVGNTLDLYFTIEKIKRHSVVNMNDYHYGNVLENPSITDSNEAENVEYYYQTIDTNSDGTNWNTVEDAETLPVGTYYMYAVIPETAHYESMITKTTEFNVLVGRPTDPIVENKIYNGELQTGVYGERGITLSGTTSAIDVGTYVAYGNISPNYEWPNGYGGIKEYTWKIYPCNINEATITLNPTQYMYDGTAHEPEVIVEFNGNRLIEGKDYTVNYRKNINVGRAEAVITGINNFSGVAIEYFTITPVELERIALESYRYFYTGDSIKPKESVYGKNGKTLVKNKDYLIEYYNNIEIGTATVNVIGIGNYYGELRTTFVIQGKDITEATAKLIGLPYIYDGSEKCPDAEVIYGGKILDEGIDYRLTYENNVNAGEKTAVAIITGTGEYSGQIRIYFTIMKADRDAYILPGKAILLGTQDLIPYYYKGEDASTTLEIHNEAIASATDKEYKQEGTIDVSALQVGKTTLDLTIAETQNYREAILKSEVTVFEKLDDAYPIYGSVVINDNDEYTNNPRTLLTLNVDFGDYMYITETKDTPNFDTIEWHEFSKSMPHEFDSLEGTKIIYVWFKDKRGNISQVASDSIILKYDATVPAVNNNIMAHDNVLLDQTQIDKMAPEIKFNEYHNKSLDIKVISKQEDIMKNGVRSGVDSVTIKYGYREAGEGMPDDKYQWQDTAVIVDLEYDKDYAFVTQAIDRAGNGSTISDETLIHTEKKYETEVTFNNTNRQYNGMIQEIEKATFAIVNDTPITGTITYTYYVDKDCTVKTNELRDGSLTEGGAPSQPGIYYVTVELKDDIVYYDIPEDGEKPPMAELRIGWDISKTNDDDVFAYPERTDVDSEEFILNVIGNGEMADLENLLITEKEENQVYWVDYKDKIVELEIANNGENQVENIGAKIFNNLDKIEEIIIPDTIEKIGDYAFEGCISVKEPIVIPTSVIEIGANPFVNVNTPAFETEFGHRVFDTIDGVLVDLNQEVLIAYPNGKIDEKYNVPETIKTIEESAFSGADNVKDVVIPNGVETIETRAFYDCPNLEVIEIEDLMNKSDNVINLNTIGNEAFSNIKEGSIIYTFSEYVAEKFEEDRTHLGEDTEVYYPPVFTLHPIDMNGAVGRKVKFIVDTKPGYPEVTYYQWFIVKDENATVIDGETEKEYTTDSLIESNDQDRYYSRAYNAQYYYDRGYVNSDEAVLTMLENANYIVERGNYNTYLFERLQPAFDFAIDDDVIKPLQNVSDEEKAILNGNKSIILDLENYTIELNESIEIASGSKLEIRGATGGKISKEGEYIIENKGELILNGTFTLENITDCGIKTLDNSKLTFISGNILADRNALYAENATVKIEGLNANMTVKTSQEIATAVYVQKNTKFSMSNGNISISYNSEPTNGNIYGIYFNGEATEISTISGGSIRAEAINAFADAIANAGKSDVIIKENAEVNGSRSGVILLDSNLYGDVTIESGIVEKTTVTGGMYGILNQAQEAKIILGKAGDEVSNLTPTIVGEKLAIFNTKEKDTLEFYDGILYSHGDNIVYEDFNNTSLTLAPGRTELIDTATGRKDIITEINHSIFTELSRKYKDDFYKAAYLMENRFPTLTGPEDQVVEVGEQAVFEVIAEGGHPDIYEYQWEVSTDNGRTWTSVTMGTGATTSRYTTPIATENMNGYKYRCIVTNAKGDVISREVNLVVISTEDILNQRPVGRIVFTNGRVIEQEDDKKVVNMQLIVKTTAELESLKLNGQEIFNPENLPDGESIIVTKDPDSPILITKDSIEIVQYGSGDDELSGDDKVSIVEYTYTYNLKVYANGIITVEMRDKKNRDNIITQTVDLFHDLKVKYYLSNLTETNNYLTITFFANKPVKPISSSTNSYRNTLYLDLNSLDGGEYSYRYVLELKDPLLATVFGFEDEAKNQALVEVAEIVRVRYKQIKFNDNVKVIDDLKILDAYEIAQNLENVVEVNNYEEVQNRYGLNGVQTDMFMSRARDLGAVEILNNATKVKSYDGVFTDKIKSSVSTKDDAYEYKNSSENSFVAAAAKDINENEFTKLSGKYVDIISKLQELYKGMNVSTFNIDDNAPYMYKDATGKLTNIKENTVARAGFRATIIGK